MICQEPESMPGARAPFLHSSNDRHLYLMPSRSDDNDFRVDPGLRALVYRDNIIELAPRSFAVVQYLYRNRDRVVSKQELLDNLWPAGSAQQSLRQEIYALRTYLRGHGLEDCIVTVSQIGYRFNATVRNANTLLDDGYQPRHSQATQRTLAIASFLEGRVDPGSSLRALAWYETICKTAPHLFEAHAGAVRTILTLARRSALSANEASQRAQMHIAALSDLNAPNKTTLLLEASSRAILGRELASGYATLFEMQRSVGNSARLSHALALCSLMMGDTERALREMTVAMDLEPSNIVQHCDYGMVQIFAGNIPAAKTQFSFLHKLDADNAYIARRLAAVHALDGDHIAALELLKTQGGGAAANSTLCWALVQQGSTSEAGDVLKEMLDARSEGFVSGYFLGKAYLALGERSAAVSMLRQARNEAISATYEIDPWLASLRDYEPFKDLVSEVRPMGGHQK